MKNKVEDIIETLIINHFLDVFRDYNIMNGGDINKAQEDALASFKSIIALGSKARLEVLKEEFKYYLDFHEQRNGLLDQDIKHQEKYLEHRDSLCNTHADEILKVAKDIIRDAWNK